MGKKSGLVMSLVANRLAVSPKAQVASTRLIPQQSRGARRRWLKVRFIIPKCGLKFRAPVSPPPSGEVKFADRGAGADNAVSPAAVGAGVVVMDTALIRVYQMMGRIKN